MSVLVKKLKAVLRNNFKKLKGKTTPLKMYLFLFY